MKGTLTPDEAVDRALITLEPSSDQLVVIGGWALRLLATRPEAMPLGREPLVTTDLDVAIRSVTSSIHVDVGEHLAEAGFEVRMSGEDRPPATEYVIETTSGEFSVEFVGQRRGGHVLRSGRVNATSAALGVVVQLLPHLRPGHGRHVAGHASHLGSPRGWRLARGGGAEPRCVHRAEAPLHEGPEERAKAGARSPLRRRCDLPLRRHPP